MATASISELTGPGAILQASSPEDSGNRDTLVAGDFRLHLCTRRATVQGQELPLTQEEFELLVFLVGHPKSIITPHTRVSTRWGTDQVHQADFLRVLGQLREKLASLEGCSHYIRTEPWIVYQFDPHHRDDVQ